MKINFESFAVRDSANQQSMLTKVGIAPKNMGEFHSILISHLRMTPVKLKTFEIENVLYFFTVLDCNKHCAKRICETIASMKEDKDVYVSLPQVNLANAGSVKDNETVLYVGKTKGNFIPRLKQHVGKGSQKTYALHLNEWKRQPDLKDLEIKLYYLEINSPEFKKMSPEDQSVLLQELESVLILNLKPILGKSGQ